jgi:competence ComEA-like helix-hairpin-helix protein
MRIFSSRNLNIFGVTFLLVLAGLYIFNTKFQPARQGFIEEVKEPPTPLIRPKFQVPINDANVDEIASLPGIGPKRAEDIVKFRKELGGFRSLDQLLNVPGIGPKTLEKLRPRIRL